MKEGTTNEAWRVLAIIDAIACVWIAIRLGYLAHPVIAAYEPESPTIIADGLTMAWVGLRAAIGILAEDYEPDQPIEAEAVDDNSKTTS